MMNVDPGRDICFLKWRKRRDLNPRYGLTPYDSLANCWFQPLTHFSVLAKKQYIIRQQNYQGSISATGKGLKQPFLTILVVLREYFTFHSFDNSMNDLNVHFLNTIRGLSGDNN